MKPPLFKYLRVQSLEEASSVLAEHRGDAKILAGGQSLVPMMNFRVAAPAILVDINPVKELEYIRVADGWLHVGAGTRQRSLEKTPEVREKCPLLAAAVKWVGHPQIRNRGTVGGSLAHGEPTAELALVATLLDARLVIQAKGKSRTVGPTDFFQGPMSTCMDEDEILTQVSFPAASSRSGYGFRELCIRHGDFAIIAAAVQLTLSKDGRCVEARVAVSGAGPKAQRIGRAEKALLGDIANAKLLDAAAAEVPGEVQPISDLKGSADYRREMARVFVRRALEDAWAMAKEV